MKEKSSRNKRKNTDLSPREVNE